jgi:hypothetical protein
MILVMNPDVAASDAKGCGWIGLPQIQWELGVMTRAIAVLSAAHLPQPFVGFAHMVAAFWREVMRDAARPYRPYRPERHYMRGPGPAWHAKHGGGISG